jgi:hypothetical protein
MEKEKEKEKKKGIGAAGMFFGFLIALVVAAILIVIVPVIIAGLTISSPCILIGFLVYKKWKYNLKVKSDERKFQRVSTNY